MSKKSKRNEIEIMESANALSADCKKLVEKRAMAKEDEFAWQLAKLSEKAKNEEVKKCIDQIYALYEDYQPKECTVEAARFIRQNVVPNDLREAIEDKLASPTPNIMHLCAKKAGWVSKEKYEQLSISNDARQDLLDEYKKDCKVLKENPLTGLSELQTKDIEDMISVIRGDTFFGNSRIPPIEKALKRIIEERKQLSKGEGGK